MAFYTKPDIPFAKKYFNRSNAKNSTALPNSKYFILLFDENKTEISSDDILTNFKGEIDENKRKKINNYYKYFSEEYKIKQNQDKLLNKLKDEELSLHDLPRFMLITSYVSLAIVPISAEAKFISSVANIYELLFLVAIFNAILSPGINTLIQRVSSLSKKNLPILKSDK